MDFDEANSSHLKDWIIKRLENISDADSDVLADYVLALIKSDEPEAQVKSNCAENLEDFLRDHTQKFVDDLFASLSTKSYLPGYVPPSKLSAAAASFQPPSGPAQTSFQPQGDQSRKRGREGSEARDGHYGRGANGDRAIKQSRRGQGGRGGGRGGANGGFGGYPHQQGQSMSTPPPGFPQLDPSNPMAAIMAMQAMGFPSLPGFPGFPGSPGPAGQAPTLTPSIRRRCRDYDTKGYCAAGSNCPYEHGMDHIVVPGGRSEHDSREPSHHQERGGRGRGARSRGRNNRGDFSSQRGGRSAFSSAAPNHDHSITSIVVENIPQEHFSEPSVRDFFAQFGTIESITLQSHRSLAVIKFADWAAANSAYDSPKVIFDNRFVKVYWYKPEAVDRATAAAVNGEALAAGTQGGHGGGEPAEGDTEMIDPEEFARKQAEAQAAYEEKARKLKEAEAQKEEIQQKIRAAAEERRKLMEKLAAKTAAKAGSGGAGSANGTGTGTGTNGTPTATAASAAANGETPKSDAKTSATDALRAKLAELEAEAEALGVPAEDTTVPPYYQQQQYPPFRGRGGYTPYARGAAGGFRGRGRGGWRGGAAAPAGGAVARLDNRPRSVEIRAMDEGVDFAGEKEGEALRVCLFAIGDFTAITPTLSSHAIGKSTSSNPAANNTNDDDSTPKTHAIISFPARYMADIFIDSVKRSNSSIAGIGKVELGWVANDVAKSVAEAAGTLVGVEGGGAGGGGGDVDMGGSVGNGNQGQADEQMEVEGEREREVDYDVADEDEDRWMR